MCSSDLVLDFCLLEDFYLFIFLAVESHCKGVGARGSL